MAGTSLSTLGGAAVRRRFVGGEAASRVVPEGPAPVPAGKASRCCDGESALQVVVASEPGEDAAVSEAGATSGGGATSGSPGNGGRGSDRRGQPVPKSERDVRRPVPESERNGRRGKIAGSVGAGRPPERTRRPSSSRVGAEASKRRRPWRGAATELTRSGGNFWEAAAELALGRRRREEISGLGTGGGGISAREEITGWKKNPGVTGGIMTL